MSDQEWHAFWERIEGTRVVKRPRMDDDASSTDDDEENTVREFVKKNRTRRRRIFVRTGSDCNMCINCKNKKRLGGPGKRKHACKNRRIESITYANDAA